MESSEALSSRDRASEDERGATQSEGLPLRQTALSDLSTKRCLRRIRRALWRRRGKLSVFSRTMPCQALRAQLSDGARWERIWYNLGL